MDPRSRRLEKHRCLEAPKAGSGACLTSPLIEAALLVVLIFILASAKVRSASSAQTMCSDAIRSKALAASGSLVVSAR
jgi:hypothetical protein